MKTLLRLLIGALMFALAGWATEAYAFSYAKGYPIFPLLGLAACLWALAELRPRHSRRAVAAEYVRGGDSLLFLLLALLGSAFILNLRGEAAFQPQWVLRMAILTFFLLLVPTVAAHAFTRRHFAVSTLVALALLALLWKGTELQRISRQSATLPQPHWQTTLALAPQR